MRALSPAVNVLRVATSVSVTVAVITPDVSALIVFRCATAAFSEIVTAGLFHTTVPASTSPATDAACASVPVTSVASVMSTLPPPLEALRDVTRDAAIDSSVASTLTFAKSTTAPKSRAAKTSAASCAVPTSWVTPTPELPASTVPLVSASIVKMSAGSAVAVFSTTS